MMTMGLQMLCKTGEIEHDERRCTVKQKSCVKDIYQPCLLRVWVLCSGTGSPSAERVLVCH